MPTSPQFRWRLILNATTLSSNAKLVGHIIESHAHNSAFGYHLGAGILAAEASLHRDTVRRAVAELEEHGFVVILRRWNRDKRVWERNGYQLCWPWSPPPLRGTRTDRVPE
jgi:hypothetical protein